MKRKRRSAAGAALSAILLLLAATPALAIIDTVSAYAFGVSVDYNDGTTHFTQGPTPVAGPIPATGGSEFITQASEVGPKLTATDLYVQVDGIPGNNGGSIATANAYNVNALNQTVTADRVLVTCVIQDPSDPRNIPISGHTYLYNATIAGQSYANVWPSDPYCGNVCGLPPPNTVIALNTALFVGTVTLNEQTYDALTNTITVNGVHIHGIGGSAGTGDIIISHVECDALPAGPAPVIPESPLAILIPLVGLVAIGGAWYLRRNPIARASKSPR